MCFWMIRFVQVTESASFTSHSPQRLLWEPTFGGEPIYVCLGTKSGSQHEPRPGDRVIQCLLTHPAPAGLFLYREDPDVARDCD